MQRNGSETSSTPDTSPAATLTSGASPSSAQGISRATPKLISSQASADGLSPSVSQGGLTIDLFGQVPAPASPSLPPVRARRAMTNVTCGLRGFLSSPSAALQSSLENRLRRQLDGAGSTLFSLTWRARATPAGRPYSQLVGSVRRTSETDFGSWPTPAAQEPGGTLEMHNARRRKAIAKGIQIGASSQGAMSHCAQLAVWPTPMAGTPAQKGYNEAGNTDSGRKVVALSSWATPTARDGRSEHGSPEMMERRTNRPQGKPLSKMALFAGSGPTPNGSTAQTEKPGLLDPDHSRWVMGYSGAHLSCAPTETPSSLRSRRNLSLQR